MAKEFIANGALCECNNGSTISQIKVPDQNFSYLNGNKLCATTQTLGSNVIKTFGHCKAKNNTCKCTIAQWSKYFTKLKIGANAFPLTDESYGFCPLGGGKVTFKNTAQIPSVGVKQLMQANDELNPTGEPAALTEHQIRIDIAQATPDPSKEDNNIKGYIYNEQGEFLEHKAGSEEVFLAKKYTVQEIKGGKKYTYTDIEDLQIKHDEFTYITGVLYYEDNSSFEGAATVIQTTFNAVKLRKGDGLTLTKQAEYAKKLLATAYSSVEDKTNMADTNSRGNKIMRRGLIHVLKGGEDYSNGSVLWDGIDFADKGCKHNKAKKDGGISITKDIWTQFVNVCETIKSEIDGRLVLNVGGKNKTKEEIIANIPFVNIDNAKILEEATTIEEIDGFKTLREAEIQKQRDEIKKSVSNLHYVDENLFESLGTGTFNKDRILFKANVVRGRQIYWRANTEESKNKKYDFKYIIINF